MRDMRKIEESFVGAAILMSLVKYLFWFVMTVLFLDDVIAGAIAVAQAFGHG